MNGFCPSKKNGRLTPSNLEAAGGPHFQPSEMCPRVTCHTSLLCRCRFRVSRRSPRPSFPKPFWLPLVRVSNSFHVLGRSFLGLLGWSMLLGAFPLVPPHDGLAVWFGYTGF